MGLSKQIQRNTQQATSSAELTKEEYEKLFEILREVLIKGKDVHVMYNVISKLQASYLEKYTQK